MSQVTEVCFTSTIFHLSSFRLSRWLTRVLNDPHSRGLWCLELRQFLEVGGVHTLPGTLPSAQPPIPAASAPVEPEGDSLDVGNLVTTHRYYINELVICWNSRKECSAGTETMKNIGFCRQDHGSLQCVEIRNKPHVYSIYTAGQVLQIAIPAGVSSGQTLSVTVPDGQQLNFTVPPGVSGGSELQLWYDPVAGTVSPLV